MNLLTEQNGTVTIITLREERLDAHNSDQLKAEINRLFEGGTKDLLVDLKEVRFIDSSGLGVLVSGFKNASTRQGSIKLCSLQTQVKSMFELTRLHQSNAVPVYGDQIKLTHFKSFSNSLLNSKYTRFTSVITVRCYSAAGSLSGCFSAFTVSAPDSTAPA